jgi:16S rRNA C967 or C1407 C5-methylase (RsmB/RsmF family)
MLKVGGKLSYSTCSLSPIEDEAVVAAILKHYGDKIRLVKVDLPGFKF